MFYKDTHSFINVKIQQLVAGYAQNIQIHQYYINTARQTYLL